MVLSFLIIFSSNLFLVFILFILLVLLILLILLIPSIHSIQYILLICPVDSPAALAFLFRLSTERLHDLNHRRAQQNEENDRADEDDQRKHHFDRGFHRFLLRALFS